MWRENDVGTMKRRTVQTRYIDVNRKDKYITRREGIIY